MRTTASILWALLMSQASAAADASGPPSDFSAEIVVTAPRGRAGTGVEPLVDLSTADLDSYGADTLSDLVDALRPLTRSTRSDQMAVVLINGHLAGQTEFDNLPREAIERVEVLPESVALQYGFSENQRVLNFVLREHYRALPLRASGSGATEGGSRMSAADGSRVRLDDESRVTLLASYKDSAWLRESDRGIGLPDSYFRTLQPDKTDAKLAATFSRAIAGVSASLEGSYQVTSSDALQGLAHDTADGGGVRQLGQSAPARTARLATQLTGQLHDFIWGATAYYMHVIARSSSDTGVDAAGVTVVDRSRTAFAVGNLQLSASGPVGRLPAGLVIANFKFALQYQGFATRQSPPAAAVVSTNLERTVRSGNVNARLPLASRERQVLPALGELSATFNATLDDVSQFGTLTSGSVGLDWRPIEKLRFDAIYTDHSAAPTLQQLRAPPVITPNVESFDYVTGTTSAVTQINGGDASLAATQSQQASIGMVVGPFAGKTTFNAHYERSWIRDAVGLLPPTTAAVQLAFPERFVRGSDGSLVVVDTRWVNLARQRVDDLKWGLNVWVPLGEAATGAMPNRWEMSLFDTWYLHDVTLIRAGLPALDLLNGGPTGASSGNSVNLAGGQPRHKIEFHTLLHRDGFGVLLAAAWSSPTHVDSGASAAPNTVFFGALGTADLRIFADLEKFSLTKARRSAAGTRLSFSVTNLFDTRQRVRDAAGTTPIAFLPGYLDPPGRTLGINLRKVF